MQQANTRKIKHMLYFIFDALSISLAFLAAYNIFSVVGWQKFSITEMVSITAFVILIMSLSHLSVGLYESKVRESIRNVLRRCILSTGLVYLAFQVSITLFPVTPHNLTIVFGLLFSASLQTMWRHWAIYHGGLDITKRKVLFIGTGERAAFLPNRMRRDVDRKHFDGWFFLKLKESSVAVTEHEEVYELSKGESLIEYIHSLAPDVIVLANDRHEKLNVHDLLGAKMSGIEVVELEDFAESELGQLAIEKMRPEWLLLSKGFNFNRFAYNKINYLFNAALALFVLLLTWPFMIAAAIAIYLDDGRRDKAGFLYRQIRVGENGKPFGILKFRSMGKHAEKDGAQWAVENDVRVTRIGKYLRKYRIDELPQLFNVLKGEMCFVGPRPERPEFVEDLAKDIPFFHYRHSVKPGLTGWAQISYPYGASEKDSFEKLKFDLYYIKHRSFLLDMFTLLRTVEIVLFGRGR